MTTIESITRTIERPAIGFELDEAHLAAASFLARYSGRTLDAYRHDLRGYFQWAADNSLDVLKATRPHIELFRGWMEDRGLAASTIDRRLSTVCGFYRFAHIDRRIGSNPAQYVRRPQVHPSEARGLDRSELGVFLFTAEQYDHYHAALAVLLGLNGLRVSEACATNLEDLGFERGHRTCGSSGRATSLRRHFGHPGLTSGVHTCAPGVSGVTSGHDVGMEDDRTAGRDRERVASRAESLSYEQDLDIDDVEAQATALLAESDERAEDPDTMEHRSTRHERRTSEETVEPI